ncbi:hypothetical protein ACIQVT_34595 [Streptomyces sp. NPDC100445]|uniref:hypothetical protein n=1 Tax=Streptomyces sp. NPDC100445 TaxID=3366102 RepID=UPI003819EF66
MLSNGTAYGRPTEYTVGFTCDGRTIVHGYKCGQRISLASFYAVPDRHGWTLSPDGKAYCPMCGPRHQPQRIDSPPHRCPEPPPAPEPPKLGAADSIGNAPGLVLHYWHTDEKRVRRWRTPTHTVFPDREGLHVLKFYKNGPPRVHCVPWPYVISLTTEQETDA